MMVEKFSLDRLLQVDRFVERYYKFTNTMVGGFKNSQIFTGVWKFMQFHFIFQAKLDLRRSSYTQNSRKTIFPDFTDFLDDPQNLCFKLFDYDFFQRFLAEDLRMNADPIHPHQRKELPSNLGLMQLASVAYIIRLWLYNYSIQLSSLGVGFKLAYLQKIDSI